MQVSSISSNINNSGKSLSFGDCAIRNGSEKLATHYSYIGRDLCVNRQMLNRSALDLLAFDNGCEFWFCGCSDSSEVLDAFMSLLYFFFENKIPYTFSLSSKLLILHSK